MHLSRCRNLIEDELTDTDFVFVDGALVWSRKANFNNDELIDYESVPF